MTKRQTISTGAILLAGSSLASYGLGLVRDRLLASQFGAGAEFDVFSASFIVPDTIMNLFGAALTTAFIPIFAKWWHQKGERSTWELTNKILQLVVSLIIIADVVALVTMPWLAEIVAPGFDPYRRDLLITTSRIMLLSPLMFSISVLAGSALQGLRRFTSYALAPVLYNLGIVAGIALLAPTFGVIGAAIGVVAGAIVHASIRVIELYMAGWRWRWPKWKTSILQEPGIKDTINLMIPRMAGLIAWQANLWIFTAIGSTLVVGSVTIFNLARNFQSLPVSLFGIALATAIFPALAIHHATTKHKTLYKDLSKAIRHIIYLTVPAAIGLSLLAIPLVDTVLGGGEFTEKAVIATGLVLAIFALSVPLESLQHILARGFYAQHDMITPVIITVIATLSNLTVSWFASRWFGAAGLALGFCAYTSVQVVLLSVLLQKKSGQILNEGVLTTIIKTASASAVMIIVVLAIRNWIDQPALVLLVASSIGAIVYTGVSASLRMPEFDVIFKFSKRLLRISK